MISRRFSFLVYAIFFMLLHCLAYSLQGDTEKMVVMARSDKIVEGTKLSPQEKGSVNVVPASVQVVGKSIKAIGGRKMKKKLHEEHINGKEMASKIASSSSSASTRNGHHKGQKRSKKIDHDEHQVKVKMSSFMVINADYHVPRSHPPKNN